MGTLNGELTTKPARQSAGQDARLYGRRDARRYAKHIRHEVAREGCRVEAQSAKTDCITQSGELRLGHFGVVPFKGVLSDRSVWNR